MSKRAHSPSRLPEVVRKKGFNKQEADFIANLIKTSITTNENQRLRNSLMRTGNIYASLRNVTDENSKLKSEQLCEDQDVRFISGLLSHNEVTLLKKLHNNNDNLGDTLRKDLTQKIQERLPEFRIIADEGIRDGSNGIVWHTNDYPNKNYYTLIIYLDKVRPKNMTKFLVVPKTFKSVTNHNVKEKLRVNYNSEENNYANICKRPPGCERGGCATLFPGIVYHGVDATKSERWIFQLKKRKI